MQRIKVEISAKTIVFTVVFLLSLLFLWEIRDLILSLFIAFIIASALKPSVEFLEGKKIPRIVSSILIYFVFLFIIVNAFGLIFPVLIREITHFVSNFPYIISKMPPYITSYVNINSLSQYLPDVTNRAISIVSGAFSNVFFIFSTFFFGFYLLLEGNPTKKILLKFYEEKDIKEALNIVGKVEKKMSLWFWGEIILMTTIGVMIFIGLSLIGVKYTLALAVFAGLLEIIPTIGPIASLFPAVLIGFSQTYFLGFATIALYFVVQQLENQLLVPLIMKRMVGLNPIITLMALIVGGKLFGILGVLLSVPFTLFLETLLIEALRIKKISV